MAETVTVRGESDSSYESMTKQEIITAIVNAVEGGTVGDIDTGFVTIIKEINKNIGLRFWVGTTAEFNALTEKPDNVLYIKTDDTSAEDINNAIAALQETLATMEETLADLETEVEGKAATNHASQYSTYGAATSSEYGHVKLVTNLTTSISYPDGWAIRGDVAYTIGQRLTTCDNNISSLQTATADSGWKTASLNGNWTGSAQYRKIGKQVFVRGSITGASSPSGSYFFNLPSGYLPTSDAHAIAATSTSSKFVNLTINHSGGNVVPTIDISTLSGITTYLNFSFFTD